VRTSPPYAGLRGRVVRVERRINPAPWPAHDYTPYGAAADLASSTEEELVISGPAGTGKSRGALERIHALCQEWRGLRVLIARKTRESLSESTLATFEDDVLGPGHPLAAGPQRPFRRRYLYPNGSAIICGGMNRASRIMSTDFDLVFVPEATELTEAEWEALSTRLRHQVLPFQALWGDCNPGPPTHWLKRRAERGACRMLESRHEDNPTLYDRARGAWTPTGQTYIGKLDRLSGVRKLRLRRGIWAAAEGLVYEDYDPAIHRLAPFAIPAAWPRYRVVDFGYRNPFVCQWWAVDPDGRLYRYREIYRTGRIVADHARDIVRLSEGESFRATICDHDAEDRATLAAAGIATVAARKAVTRGIEAVQQRLRRDGTGQPALSFLRDALVEADPDLREASQPTCTEEEVEGYVWEDGGKEQPVKEADHGLDATRYMVAHLDLKRRPQQQVTSVSFSSVRP